MPVKLNMRYKSKNVELPRGSVTKFPFVCSEKNIIADHFSKVSQLYNTFYQISLKQK